MVEHSELVKVAMLFKMISPESRIKILKSLPRDVVEGIDKIIKTDKTVVKEDGLKILTEFNQLGSLIVATNAESSVMDEYDDALLADSPNTISRKVMIGFSKMADQDTDVIYRILSDEQPLYQVVILNQLKGKKSQDVFLLMTVEEQVAFTLEAANSKNISNEVLLSISRTIENKIEEILTEKKSNFDAVLSLASGMDDNSLETYLERLPDELAEKIRANTITFIDVINQQDSVVQQVFGNVSATTIALAVANLTDEQKDKIYKNITESKRSDSEYNLGEVDLTKQVPISNAQRDIVNEAKQLRQKGTIELIK